MKKIIPVVVLLLLGFSTVKAQTGNSYLMMNFGVGRSQPGYLNSFGPHYNDDRTFGIQYVRNNRNNTAYRFGISSYHLNLPGTHNYIKQSDTFLYDYTTYNINIPKLSFGKEWQKQLHRDVVIYGGADLQLGGMFARKQNTKTIRTDSLNYYYWHQTNEMGPLAITASVRPFVGMRANWNRFVFSYELAAPADFTVLTHHSANLDAMQLKHTVSLGFMLGKKKR